MLLGKLIGRFKGIGEYKLVANLRVKQSILNSASLETLTFFIIYHFFYC